MLLGTLLLASLCAPDPKIFAQARTAYYAAVNGNANRTADSTKLFDDLHASCPGDAATLAYWGSLKLLEASHTWALWRKNSLSKQGILALDQAVASAPDNLEIRFVRAATTYDLPGFFHRREQSRADFEYLSARAQKAAADGHLDPALAAASLYYHAEFLHGQSHDKEAAERWKLAIRIAPQSRAARDSTNELKNLQ